MNYYDPAYNQYNYYPPADPKKEKIRELRRNGNYAGAMVITAIILMQFVFSIIIIILNILGLADFTDGLSGFYGMNYWLYMVIYIIVYTADFVIPGPVVSAIARRKVNPFRCFTEKQNEEKKNFDGVSMILIVLAGIGICSVANFVAGYLASFLAEFGIEYTGSSEIIQGNLPSLFISIFVIAILPGIVEEMLFRGYIMRALMPMGKGVAVFASASVFGLIHGHIVQVVFAFIVGLMLGFIAMRTGKIWPAIIVHFLNNLSSVLVEYFTLNMNDLQKGLINTAIIISIGLIGMIALLILFIRRDPIIQISPNKSNPNPQYPNVPQYNQNYGPQWQQPGYPPYGYYPQYPYPQQVNQPPQYQPYPPYMYQPAPPPVPPRHPDDALSLGERVKALCTSPAMIVAVSLALIISFFTTFFS